MNRNFVIAAGLATWSGGVGGTLILRGQAKLLQNLDQVQRVQEIQSLQAAGAAG